MENLLQAIEAEDSLEPLPLSWAEISEDVDPIPMEDTDPESPPAPDLPSPSVPPLPHVQSVLQSLTVKAWDPTSCPEWDHQPPSPSCLARVRRDLATIYTDPPPGMFVAPDQEDITKLHALIIGPFDTPYEGGFFHFLIRCPPTYPIHPPKVKLLTTGQGSVRFNPNFYSSGKVCLSILGTWKGPSWSPALSLSSLLISIQSLMTDKPYHNEPGFEREKYPGDVQKYNRIVEHETLRVAVLANLEDSGPLSLKSQDPIFSVALSSLPDYMDHYEEVCTKNLVRDGESMNDPFGEPRGKFQFGNLLGKLREMREKHPAWFRTQVREEESDTSDLSDS